MSEAETHAQNNRLFPKGCNPNLGFEFSSSHYVQEPTDTCPGPPWQSQHVQVQVPAHRDACELMHSQMHNQMHNLNAQLKCTTQSTQLSEKNKET